MGRELALYSFLVTKETIVTKVILIFFSWSGPKTFRSEFNVGSGCSTLIGCTFLNQITTNSYLPFWEIAIR